ncbi:hypothetical protein ACN20G_16075 [Streptomyces sp. BI20]|uniref:hypothetical protein n=1 Tax=Streptomyces sp. BI20 TaxID=3403460 RepID=UPI003C776EA2
MRIDPEHTLFACGPLPVLVLMGTALHEALPVLPSGADAGAPPPRPGWSLRAGSALCGLTGPTGVGGEVPTAMAPVISARCGGTVPAGTDEWCGDAAAAGGALVLSVSEPPAAFDPAALAVLAGSGTARGGFVAVRAG